MRLRSVESVTVRIRNVPSISSIGQWPELYSAISNIELLEKVVQFGTCCDVLRKLVVVVTIWIDGHDSLFGDFVASDPRVGSDINEVHAMGESFGSRCLCRRRPNCVDARKKFGFSLYSIEGDNCLWHGRRQHQSARVRSGCHQ